ncbi:MAG: ABC transporter substrate-binding protein [Gammaproteobacteria bacterium]|nr:ABC transporter substrate-binding protein [Gammaproteobacteria bacterium]
MNTLKNIVLIGILSFSMMASAQQPPLTALATVENGVRLLLDTVQQSRSFFLSDPDRYFGEVEQALVTMVDFDAVATVVMSRYADEATEEQTSRFGDIIKSTLTRFYGAALASYGGQELVFIPSDNPPSDPRADTVVGMELRGGDNGSFKLQYQMFIDGSDEWKLKNLSLGGINLGRQYYAQFAAAMTKFDNDIDQVLDNWK